MLEWFPIICQKLERTIQGTLCFSKIFLHLLPTCSHLSFSQQAHALPASKASVGTALFFKTRCVFSGRFMRLLNWGSTKLFQVQDNFWSKCSQNFSTLYKSSNSPWGSLGFLKCSFLKLSLPPSAARKYLKRKPSYNKVLGTSLLLLLVPPPAKAGGGNQNTC